MSEKEVFFIKSMEIEAKQILGFIKDFKVWEEDVNTSINIPKFKELLDDTCALRSKYSILYTEILEENNLGLERLSEK